MQLKHKYLSYLALTPLLIIALNACSSGSGNNNNPPPWFVNSGLNYSASYSNLTGENCASYGIISSENGESVPGFTVPSVNTLVAPFGFGPQYTMAIESTPSLCGSALGLNLTNCSYTAATNTFTAVVYAAGCTANLSLAQTPVDNTFINAGNYTAVISNPSSSCATLGINSGPIAVTASNTPNNFSIASLSSIPTTTFNNSKAVCMTLTTTSATIQFTACTATATSFSAVINASALNTSLGTPNCMANFNIGS